STRLEKIIGEIPHTPLDQAVKEAMRDIGVAVAPASREAA
ncbi:MAG: oxidoreductase, partial [Mesorhizobium sp.]